MLIFVTKYHRKQQEGKSSLQPETLDFGSVLGILNYLGLLKLGCILLHEMAMSLWRPRIEFSGLNTKNFPEVFKHLSKADGTIQKGFRTISRWNFAKESKGRQVLSLDTLLVLSLFPDFDCNVTSCLTYILAVSCLPIMVHCIPLNCKPE